MRTTHYSRKGLAFVAALALITAMTATAFAHTATASSKSIKAASNRTASVTMKAAADAGTIAGEQAIQNHQQDGGAISVTGTAARAPDDARIMATIDSYSMTASTRDEMTAATTTNNADDGTADNSTKSPPAMSTTSSAYNANAMAITVNRGAYVLRS